MAYTDALQDVYGRNIVFSVQLQITGGIDAKSEVLAKLADVGVQVSDFGVRDCCMYELTLFTTGDEQMAQARKAIEGIDGVKVLEVIDAAMESHRGGSCEIRSRKPIKSNTDLRIVYTPGVARVCKAIEADPSLARQYTNISNKVAIITNGTAILGLGDIGPVAGMPVMEGKSAIFWEFTGVSAEPILLDTKDVDEFISAVKLMAPTFGAIQIEDVAAPECFRITRELDAALPIPVFHDDQHGTATVVLAGLYSAIKQTGKKMEDLTCSFSGAGAAGTAIADLLLHAGVKDTILCDRAGAIYRGRSENMNPEKEALAERTNKQNATGSLADVMKGTDVFIGVSMPNIVTQDMVKAMAADPIIFALANPVSEIGKEDAIAAGAAVYADGRMMNNALAYPGIFRGALDARAESITIDMMTAAAEALANIVPEGQLMPEMMDPATHKACSDAVQNAAV